MELATWTMETDYLTTNLILTKTPRSSARKPAPERGINTPESSTQISATVEMMSHQLPESGPAGNAMLIALEMLLSSVEALGE